MLARTGDERSRTREVSLDTQRRIGEITQELSAARRDFDVDDVKLQESLVKTRLSEAHHRLAVLLLAKRSLSRLSPNGSAKANRRCTRTLRVSCLK